MATTPTTRAVVTAPARVTRGDVFEVRLLVQHAMESGHRADSGGRLLPRDIIRRVDCTLAGQLVFAADLHAAVAANPYLSFTLRATQSGALVVRWRGDNGFEHRETVNVEVV